MIEAPWGDHQPEMMAALAYQPEDIGGVVSQLHHVQDVLKLLPPLYEENPISDFNRLYTTITESIFERNRDGDFAEPTFLNRLDVEFAKRYIDALRLWSDASPHTPHSWAVLFRRVADEELRSLPCAVAGVNAHINYDLPFALVATWQQVGHASSQSAQHLDYLLINEVFERSIPELRWRYLEGWQRHIDRINLHFDDWYQNLLVTLTRNVAWDRAQKLWQHRNSAETLEGLRATFDTQTARIGRALLSPFCRFLQ